MLRNMNPDAIHQFITETKQTIFMALYAPQEKGNPLSRIFSSINDEELKNAIKNELISDDSRSEANKNAAVVLFDLYDKLPFRINISDAHQDLIDALKNDALTIEYTNTIYVFVRTTLSYITKPNTQSLISSLFFNDYQSVEWQKTLGEIHQIAYDKLMKEVNALEAKDSQLSLLEKARTLPIFSDHQANFIVTGGFGRTDAVIKIDAAIQEINNSPRYIK